VEGGDEQVMARHVDSECERRFCITVSNKAISTTIGKLLNKGIERDGHGTPGFVHGSEYASAKNAFSVRQSCAGPGNSSVLVTGSPEPPIKVTVRLGMSDYARAMRPEA
jgi:hypothetical protein